MTWLVKAPGMEACYSCRGKCNKKGGPYLKECIRQRDHSIAPIAPITPDEPPQDITVPHKLLPSLPALLLTKAIL